MLKFVTILVKFCFWDSCAGLILWPFLLLENKINRLKIDTLVKITNHQKDILYKDQKRYEYTAIIALIAFPIMFAISLWSIVGVRHASIWF